MDSQSRNQLESKWICCQCVEEPFLSSLIKSNGRVFRCDYCGNRISAYSLFDLANSIETAFERHFTKISAMSGGVPVVSAIMDAADICEEAANDIQQILEDRHFDFDLAAMGYDTEFDRTTCYEEKAASDYSWQLRWNAFETRLKSETRFFDKHGADFLASIFDGVDTMETFNHRPLVQEIGLGTSLTSIHRARVFQSDEQLIKALERPDLSLGESPSRLAIAGRLNARGISVFYGADTSETAIAEVRPPVGSRVAVAEFEIIRPLRVLDLTALNEVSSRGSYFDPQYLPCLEREAFLRSLSQKITRPVMPDDQEFDYLVTQAIADFLASELSPPLDGILFPSAQVSGKGLNLALFHKASRTEKMALSEGTTFSVVADERGYTVFQEIPQVDKPLPAKDDRTNLSSIFDPIEFSGKSIDLDLRQASLRIVPTKISVFRIRSVDFTKQELVATRVSRPKREDTPRF